MSAFILLAQLLLFVPPPILRSPIIPKPVRRNRLAYRENHK
jgi:hypothetical protein